MSSIISLLLNFLGGGVLDKVLGHLEAKANSETERRRIESLRETELGLARADVVKTGMGHAMFWVAWSIAAIPMTVWFGWGMLDTWLNGALPDTAAIPPGLMPWAQTVWDSIFYSGAGVASAQVLAHSLKK